MSTRVPLAIMAAFLLLAHSGCRRPADAHNLATVDSLLHVTDSLINAVKTLDIARIRRIDSLYALKAERVEQRMRDTLNKQEALALGNYHRTMSKDPGRTLKGQPSVLARLDVSLLQLKNLRNDVEKGLLEPAVESKYILDERAALARASADAETVFAGFATIVRDDGQYGAAVEALLAPDTIPTR